MVKTQPSVSFPIRLTKCDTGTWAAFQWIGAHRANANNRNKMGLPILFLCLGPIKTRNYRQIHCRLIMPRLRQEVRDRAIGMLEAGMSARAVATRLNVHESTISRLRRRYRETNSTRDRPRTSMGHSGSPCPFAYSSSSHRRSDAGGTPGRVGSHPSAGHQELGAFRAKATDRSHPGTWGPHTLLTVLVIRTCWALKWLRFVDFVMNFVLVIIACVYCMTLWRINPYLIPIKKL